MSRASRALWRAEAALVIRAVAAAKDTFTSDDLWEAGLRRPPDGRALGPAMHAAERDLIAVRNGEWRVSARAINHKRRVWVWRSLLRKSTERSPNRRTKK